MALLPDDLLLGLPPLGSQQEELNPVVYARLYLPETSWNFYVIEGGIEDGFWVLYCFCATEEKSRFARIPLDLLEGLRRQNDRPLILDPDFPEGPLTDVVPAPGN